MYTWAGICGDPTWAAHIAPTVYVWSSFVHRAPIRSMWFKWASGICMWAAPDLSHVAFWYNYGTHVGSAIFIPCGRFGIRDACGVPRSPPLFMYGALLAQVGPSRHLHRGTHLAPMLVNVVLYPYFWYLLTLGWL